MNDTLEKIEYGFLILGTVLFVASFVSLFFEWDVFASFGFIGSGLSMLVGCYLEEKEYRDKEFMFWGYFLLMVGVLMTYFIVL